MGRGGGGGGEGEKARVEPMVVNRLYAFWKLGERMRYLVVVLRSNHKWMGRACLSC